MLLNKTPVRTSRNFGINEIDLEIENPEVKPFNGLEINGDVENFNISEDVENKPLMYGVGKELEEQVYKEANKELKVMVENEKNKILNLEFNMGEENATLIDNIEIIAKNGANATVILKYMSDKNEKYYHNGIVRIVANENSNIEVIIINMLNNKSENYISMQNVLSKSAKVKHTIVDFGGKNSITNYYSNLIGEESKTDLNTIYLGTGNQFFDINYIEELNGQKTEANIEVQGALSDSSKKSFKGTIDFKKGCKKAKGNENEFCMLLSEEARSKALPMLLCTEEDVEGNHSSAAGKVEEDMLFYIMSRGISYKEAMKLIVKAKFNNILENIKLDELKEQILTEIDNRL